jgi:dCMP deaminase
MSRPTWSDTYFALAHVWAQRGTCDRLRAGCVFVNRDHLVVAAGYNGSLRKQPHCDDVGHLMVDGHCVRTLHSEWNAIIQAARTGVSLEGTRAYITARPCQICTKMMIQAGVSQIDYWAPYNTDAQADQVETMLAAAGIPLRGPHQETPS